MSHKKNILEKLFLGEQELIKDPITSKTKILYQSNLIKIFTWFLLLGFLLVLGTLYFTGNLDSTSFSRSNEIGAIKSTNPKVSKNATIRLLKKTDSLANELEKYKLYVNNISSVIDGSVTADYDSLIQEEELIPLVEHKLNKDSIAPSEEDIEFRSEIIEDGFSTVAIKTDDLKFDKKEKSATIVLTPPIKGIITSKYDIEENHLALDIASDEGQPVKAIMDGFVVFSDWTSDGGYVIVLQHKHNIISVYKHNSQLYKKQGDIVQSGDIISVVGSTGELSIGPHLHFELWIEGYSVDPANYIDF